jgi:hypothetical protein
MLYDHITLSDNMLYDNTVLSDIIFSKNHAKNSAGFVSQKRGKTVPSFIKQRWDIDGIFLPPFVSNEPSTDNMHAVKLARYLAIYCKSHNIFN